MENRNLEIGDYFEESTYGKVFKVVGAVESDCLVCVGTPQGYTNSGWYLIILCDENHSDMTKVLSDIGIEVTENDTIFDAVEWGKMYKELVTDEIDAATFGILLVVMVFLAISVIVTYISFMRSRVNEYCLYASIGYSRKDIYKMMMRELGLIFGISILLGIVLTSVILLFLGNLVLDHLGLVYRYLYPEQLFRIIAAFLAVIAILQIPILGTINSIKTIDLMEE
jgi:ABC-type antimicrobial peptide transport system permease subunit